VEGERSNIQRREIWFIEKKVGQRGDYNTKPAEGKADRGGYEPQGNY